MKQNHEIYAKKLAEKSFSMYFIFDLSMYFVIDLCDGINHQHQSRVVAQHLFFSFQFDLLNLIFDSEKTGT